MKENAPYSTSSLVWGICSLLFPCVGLICAIVGLILSNNGLKYYMAQPDLYEGAGMLRAGKVTSIIGLVLGILSVVIVILAILLIGVMGIFMSDLL